MKKFLALVLAVLMVFSCVTGCAKKDGPSLADAVAYLESLYKDGAKETPVDYDVVAKVLVNNVEFNVTWETDNENISVKESDKAGFFTVDVPDKTEAEIPYKLKATIKEGLKDAGYTVFGGVNAPYIWLKTPNNMTSWEFFDYLLENANVVGTPGSGFGPSGEGYFRLTAFGMKCKIKIRECLSKRKGWLL